MSAKEIRSKDAPIPVGPYSQAVEMKGIVFISGVLPYSLEKQELIKNDIEEATSVVFKNLDAILSAGDISKVNIVKATIFLKDLKNFEKVNNVYGEYFKGLKTFPARSCVQVSELPKGADIEIEFVAIK